MDPQEPSAFDAAAAADFLEASADWPPRATLLAALEHLATRPASSLVGREGERRAVDLGCGAGTETIELLRRGWFVDSIDAHQHCLDFTSRRAEAAGLSASLGTRRCGFEELVLPPRSYAIAHAGFALPFCREASFDQLWNGITKAVLPGGCFAGQLFGAREPMILDAVDGTVTWHDHESIQRLLGPGNAPRWRILSLEEIDRSGRGPRGEPKHWHVFHVVLERANDPPPDEGRGQAVRAALVDSRGAIGSQ